MSFKNIFKILIACIILTGCAAMTPKDYAAGSPIPAGNGVAVIYVESTFFGRTMYDISSEPRLGVNTVAIRAGHAQVTNGLLPDVFGRVSDSYVYMVLPASKPGERYVATAYQLNANLNASRRNLTCIGHTAPSFEIKAGMVTYVGDYKISDIHRVSTFRVQWRDGFSRNLERARQDIGEAHPEFKNMPAAFVESVVLDFGQNCDAPDI